MNGTLQYTIRPYDTIWMLAQIFNTTVDSIMDLNPGIDPRKLFIGQVITIRPGYRYYQSSQIVPGSTDDIGDIIYPGNLGNTGGMAPGGTAPRGAVPGETAPRGAVPGGMAPGGMAPGGTTPGGMAPGETAPRGAVPGGMAPGGMTPGGTTPGGMAPGGMTPGGMAPGGTTPGGTTPTGMTFGGSFMDFMDDDMNDMNDMYDMDDMEMVLEQIRDYMRMLWEQHVMWTRMAQVGIIHELPETELIIQRLLRNPVDFANALAPFYGDEAADEFQNLLTGHLTIAAELINALKAGNNNAAADANRRWRDNAEQIAAFLGSINPNWSEDDWSAMLNEHLDLLSNSVTEMLAKNYEESINGFDDVEMQALEMADVMAEGIQAQFSEMR